ncbi:polysaccharide deacetylase family protein [Algoriphagus halophilus]|uniref:Peptidoglycan/xylan/chitin deacetylase, PgdA/CDA1 family n=1 Tax=Algoriphagus halophilus TaxID=226505 RepID=A0A1N6H1Z1_9BACT|nr:polysaccharide deacetylase family protein [Algoriphagus halophilus]SIO13800.1 Peptidoglycan/xylan/chitin deacetylase, PgdA/CDA1 family [Algoriphagus halophilus]
MVFHTVPLVIQRLFPQRIWSKNSEGNQVFLTFDDGPVPGVTDFVLQELSKRAMKATFFMVGDNVRKHSSLAKEVLSQGHQLANHTFHHLNGWKTKREKYVQDFLACNQIIEDQLGVQTKLFRPPYGLMTSAEAKEISKTHSIVMWNMLSGDYDLRLDAKVVLRKSIENTGPGSIVLFHDQQKTNSVLPKILPTYLDKLLDKGWTTATL